MIVVLLQIELENGIKYITEKIETNKEFNTCIFIDYTTKKQYLFEPKEIYSIIPHTRVK